MNRKNDNYYTGCLLGGAIGDALGWPIEFMNMGQIIHRYGDKGIQELDLKGKQYAEITDDTQMTLFTAEGLIRAECRSSLKGICHAPSVIHHAYLRWLITQGETPAFEIGTDGWLFGVKKMHKRRAPGGTCLSSLRKSRGFGEKADNDSKGCGGVMRMAPVGLFVCTDQVFLIANEATALTHGHPTGQIASAAFAFIINQLVLGKSLSSSIQCVLDYLIEIPHHDETSLKIQETVKLASIGIPSSAK